MQSGKTKGSAEPIAQPAHLYSAWWVTEKRIGSSIRLEPLRADIYDTETIWLGKFASIQGGIMNRLQLATLLSWAGEEGVKGRKRLQKVVFALQQIGCPLECRFILHHYGPYSRDVADICDEMVSASLVEESCPEIGSRSYTYKLKPKTSALLEKTASDAKLNSFKDRAESLWKEDLWNLELGSTILYFFRQSEDWSRSLSKACEFKKVPEDIERSRNAFDFAQSLVTPAAQN